MPISEFRRKLGLTSGLKAYTLHAPAEYMDILSLPIPANNLSELGKEPEWIQAFYESKDLLEDEISELTNRLSINGQLWISWPKKSSNTNSDLSDKIVRQIGLDSGLVDIKVASISGKWSALNFVNRSTN